MLDPTTFDLGENKRVGIDVFHAENQAFTITDATYELSLKGVVESEGACTISEHYVSVLISPKQKGRYRLRFIYNIGVEKFIDDMEVAVS
jgi:hypothetical protein